MIRLALGVILVTVGFTNIIKGGKHLANVISDIRKIG